MTLLVRVTRQSAKPAKNASILKPDIKVFGWGPAFPASPRSLPKENQTVKEEGEITLLRPLIPQTAIGLLTTEGDPWHPKPGLWNNLEGLGGEGGWDRGSGWGGIHVHLWPIHVDVWQKPSQYCNYPPIKKINYFLKKRKGVLRR